MSAPESSSPDAADARRPSDVKDIEGVERVERSPDPIHLLVLAVCTLGLLAIAARYLMP